MMSKYNYYGPNNPSRDPGHCPGPFPPPPKPPKPDVLPGNPVDRMIAEHNETKSAHPYILSLIKKNTSPYYCKNTIAERDDIIEDLRELGMMVYVIETDQLFRLETALDNTGWVELDVKDKDYIRIGRYNPPEDPTNGVVYYDFSEKKLKYYEDGWQTVPTSEDIQNAIAAHSVDKNAHAERFAEVENKWLSI